MLVKKIKDTDLRRVGGKSNLKGSTVTECTNRRRQFIPLSYCSKEKTVLVGFRGDVDNLKVMWVSWSGSFEVVEEVRSSDSCQVLLDFVEHV